ncbi:hypothetical protein U1Q18_049209 [Sarracenia purpurea var. burkii]
MNGNAESSESSAATSTDASSNNHILSDLSSTESMSKVCQENLFQPLLNALSADNLPLNSDVQMNSDDHPVPVNLW